MEKVKDSGLFGLKVVQDGKHRITISGTVKSQSQKNKVIQAVSAAELYVPVDYELVVAAEKLPKLKPSSSRRPRESFNRGSGSP